MRSQKSRNAPNGYATRFCSAPHEAKHKGPGQYRTAGKREEKQTVEAPDGTDYREMVVLK